MCGGEIEGGGGGSSEAGLPVREGRRGGVDLGLVRETVGAVEEREALGREEEARAAEVAASSRFKTGAPNGAGVLVRLSGGVGSEGGVVDRGSGDGGVVRGGTGGGVRLGGVIRVAGSEGKEESNVRVSGITERGGMGRDGE
jgi:hypothetical protein